jgi:hypothetical protein
MHEQLTKDTAPDGNSLGCVVTIFACVVMIVEENGNGRYNLKSRRWQDSDSRIRYRTRRLIVIKSARKTRPHERRTRPRMVVSKGIDYAELSKQFINLVDYCKHCWQYCFQKTTVNTQDTYMHIKAA